VYLTTGLDTPAEQKNISTLMGFEAQIVEPMTFSLHWLRRHKIVY